MSTTEAFERFELTWGGVAVRIARRRIWDKGWGMGLKDGEVPGFCFIFLNGLEFKVVFSDVWEGFKIIMIFC